MAEIKVGGTLVTALLDKKIANTDQLYDKKKNKFQEEINTDIYTRLGQVEGTPDISESIVDNLTSTATNKALSANQGRILNAALQDKASNASVDTKISNAIDNIGAGNVNTDSNFTANNKVVVTVSGNKKIAASSINISDLVTSDRISNITTEINSITRDIEDLNSDISVVNTDISNINTKVSNITTDIDGITREVDNINTDMSTITTDIDNINTDIRTINTSVSNINTNLGSKGNVSTTDTELTKNFIIVGNGNKNITVSAVSLDSINNSGAANTWRPITVGSTTLNDTTTTLKIVNGSGISLGFSNGTLTISSTNSGSGTGSGTSYTLPAATNTALGGIQIGYTSANKNYLPIELNNNKAFVKITKDSITTALGYTPVDYHDLPSIPTTLPSPGTLTIVYDDIDRSYELAYDGSKNVTLDINLMPYSKLLSTTTDPGAPGIYVGTISLTLTDVKVNKNEPNAVIIMPGTHKVTFSNSKYKLMSGMDTLEGKTTQKKCYCISYINDDLVLVNCALYEIY